MRNPLLGALAAVFTGLFVVAHIDAPAMPQEQRLETPSVRFSIQSQLVEIYLTVIKGKQLVPNLTASDFEIKEDGIPVSIDRLDSQEVPLQIVLLVDTSESVQDSLRSIQDAAAAFVESLHSDDRVMLALFNSEVRAFPQTTEDREPILKEIRNARAHGMTRLYETLLLGMQYLDGKPGRKAIVCFTDGEDTAGTHSRLDVLNAAARSGYPIYAIGAGAGLGLSSLQMILSEFAEINGGKAFFIHSLRKLREAFAEVASELRSAYVLNYYTRIPPDGQWHKLSVTTKDPAYTAYSRKGFFARSP
jgi:VWFA-related protein